MSSDAWGMFECRWCGAERADGERLPGRVRCRECGVATTAPWPTEAELDAAYAGAYRPEGGRFSGIGDALLRRTRRSLAGRLDRIAPPGPVLDVGSGDGDLLAALRARGRVAVGVERTPGEAATAGDDGETATSGWAVVVFWHSLEHLPEPAPTLDGATGRLLPGGVIVVAAPNAASLQAWVFGERWFALDPPRHLVHLTAGALIGRLRQLGLTVERVSYLRGGQVLFGWLDGLVAELPGHPSLYDAIRRPRARFRPMSGSRRGLVLLAAMLLAPLALVAAAAEVLLRRGGSFYVEARS
jgi:SAM-dependent methyltransferase